MKPHPRIRKTIKWGGAAVTVLLVAVWIGSCFFTARHFDASGRAWTIAAGNVVFQYPTGSFRFAVGSYFDRNQHPYPLQWTVTWGLVTWNGYRVYYTPLWPLVLTSLLATASVWVLDTLARRRERLGRCPKCNYDRAGLGAGAVCPECGSAGARA